MTLIQATVVMVLLGILVLFLTWRVNQEEDEDLKHWKGEDKWN